MTGLVMEASKSLSWFAPAIETQIRFTRGHSYPTTVLYFKLTMKKNLNGGWPRIIQYIVTHEIKRLVL